jgi:hypothetical protein
MSIDVGRAPNVEHSAHGRYQDNRNPNTLLQNGQARAAEVTNFIEGLTKVATPLIKDQLTKQANQQVGELLQTQDPVALMRSSATPEQRALLRQLSPQARDIIENQAAQGAVTLYAETHQAERAKRLAVLQSTTASPEDKAKARAEAKAAALEASGVSQMPPQALAQYGDTLARVDAELDGREYKAVTEQADKEYKTKWKTGIRSRLMELTKWRLDVASKGDEKQQLQNMSNFRDSFENTVVKDSAAGTPSEQAQLWGEALTEEVLRLKAVGQYEDAMNLLGTMESLGQLGPKAPSGIAFFDQKLTDGRTLSYVVSSLRDAMEDEYKKFQNEQALERNVDILQRAAKGDPEARVGFQNALAGMSAQQTLTFLSAFGQAENFGQSPSPQQEQKEADLRFQIAQGVSNPEETWKQVKASGLTPGQIKGLAGQIVKGSNESTALVANARNYLGDEAEAARDLIARSAGITDKEDVTRIGRDLFTAASRATEQRIERLQASGQNVSQDQAKDLFRNELEAIRNTRLKEAGKLKEAYSNTPDRRVATELQQFQQSVQQSGGKVTVQSFPVSVRQAFQKNFPNVPMTQPALEKYFMSRMQQIKDGENKPVYGNPQKTLQEIIKQGRGVNTSDPRARYADSLGGALGSSPMGALLRKTQELLKGTENAIEGLRGGGQDKPSPAGPQSAKPKPVNPGTALVSSGLQLVANVLTPPAAAATLQDNPTVINDQALATFGKVWKRQQRVDIQTEPLPQVTATAQVGMAPLRITSDRHPMFVAIGISEGTRTPNGGYTKAYYGHKDPGNGVWNVGTVSGQQGGSPGSSDRRWMGILTSQSVSVAPILQRVGLQPGTQGWNRVLFNVLDLSVQAPAAARDFIAKLPQVVRQGASIEAIAKARADSFINPRTGRLDAGGFGNSYSRLFSDQRSRAGVWDYRRRI